MLKLSYGGLADAARVVQPAMAVLRTAQGRAMTPIRLRRAMRRYPHTGLAPNQLMRHEPRLHHALARAPHGAERVRRERRLARAQLLCAQQLGLDVAGLAVLGQHAGKLLG